LIRPAGALAVVVGVQLFVPGLYFPPVLKYWLFSMSVPPHTIISLPVQTAVWISRPAGTLVVLVTVQVLVFGLYLPPVSKVVTSSVPPQMIISLPVQTAVGPYRALGALTVLVAVQLFVLGLYRPPVLK
jgi:hypothetical protein